METGKKNWIYEYYQGIKNGTYCVGRYILALYEYIVQHIADKSIEYKGKEANLAIEWIEKHCFHVEGALAPGNIQLEVWQKALISCVFGLFDPGTENPTFREIVLIIARKNGKSLLASCIANYILQVKGGYGARIYTVAPKLEQADIIYGNTWAMIQLDPEYQEKVERVRKKREASHQKVDDDETCVKKRVSDLFVPVSNSTMKKIAFSAKRADGFNPSLAICDEIAAWEGDKGLKQYDVLKSGMGSRTDGRMLACTTAGYVNDSIYDELLKRSTRFLMGDSREKRLLPFLYIIDDVEKWNDINELQKSNPNMNVSVSMDYFIDEIAIAENSFAKRAEFICKYACIKQNSSLAWLPVNVVDDAGGDPLRLDDFRDTYCVGGIDLSQTRDLTACCVVIERGGELYTFAHFFLPAEKIDECTQRDGIPYNIYIQRGILTPSGDNFIDYHDCYNWFVRLVEEYQILPLQIGYDRYSAQYLIQDLKAYGFHCDDVYQGENLYPVMQEMQGMLEDRKLHIGDNDLLKAHLLNSAVKMSTERGRGKLVKLSPALHIDGTAALLDALTVRQKWFSEIGEQLKN